MKRYLRDRSRPLSSYPFVFLRDMSRRGGRPFSRFWQVQSRRRTLLTTFSPELVADQRNRAALEHGYPMPNLSGGTRPAFRPPPLPSALIHAPFRSVIYNRVTKHSQPLRQLTHVMSALTSRFLQSWPEYGYSIHDTVMGFESWVSTVSTTRKSPVAARINSFYPPRSAMPIVRR